MQTLITKAGTLRDDIKEFFARFMPGSEDCMMKVRFVGDILWCKNDDKGDDVFDLEISKYLFFGR